MCTRLVLHLILPLLVVQAQARQCGDIFLNNPQILRLCTQGLCIIFKKETSILQIDPKLQAESEPKPFNCLERTALYQQLVGAPLSINDRTPLRNATCIWMGHDQFCKSFDHILEFLHRADPYKLQLVLIGLPFVQRNRISLSAIASAPVWTGQLAIVSHGRHAVLNLHQAAVAFFAPFQISTWIFILLVLLAIVVTYPVSHLRGQTWKHMVDSLFEPLVPAEWLYQPHVVNEYPDHETRRWFRNTCKITYVMLIFVACIPYEAAIQEVLAISPSHVLPFHLGDMSVQQFQDFVVLRDTAFDTMLQFHWDKKYHTQTPPWTLVDTQDEAYDFIATRKRSYTFALQDSVRFDLSRLGLCSRIAAYESRLPAYTSVFYYSRYVPVSIRLETDRKLTEMLTNGETQSIMERFTKTAPAACGEPRRALGPALLLPSLIVTVAPVLTVMWGVLLSRVLRSIFQSITRKLSASSSRRKFVFDFRLKNWQNEARSE